MDTHRVTTVYIYYIKGVACRGLTFSQGVQVHSCGTQRKTSLEFHFDFHGF